MDTCLIELQILTQTGLTYGKGIFDQEQYKHIRKISAEVVFNLSDIPYETVLVYSVMRVVITPLKLISTHQSFEMRKSFLLKKMMENSHCPVDGVI